MSLEVKLVRSEDLVEADIDNDKVMMDIESGLYFGLDAIAARIWALLEQPLSVSELVNILTQEFDVDAEQCRKDLEPFLAKLQENNLISFE